MDENVEARFARKLASNDLKIRNKTLRSLKKWMIARSRVENAFTELQMLKLWRGMFMCMWHSDKPLVQEELAESLTSIVHKLEKSDAVLLFVRCFFCIMSREWVSIDRLRLDKFYMLIRRMLRHIFQYLMDNDWDDSLVDSLVHILSDGPLNPDLSKTCSGIQLHMVEIYLPELLTVAANAVPAQCSLRLLQPCCQLLANTKDPLTAQVIESSVLGQLVVGKKALKLNIDVGAMSERLLQLAVSRDTVGRNRMVLYTLRQRLQEFAAAQEMLDQSENSHEIEGYGDDMDSRKGGEVGKAGGEGEKGRGEGERGGEEGREIGGQGEEEGRETREGGEMEEGEEVKGGESGEKKEEGRKVGRERGGEGRGRGCHITRRDKIRIVRRKLKQILEERRTLEEEEEGEEMPHQEGQRTQRGRSRRNSWIIKLRKRKRWGVGEEGEREHQRGDHGADGGSSILGNRSTPKKRVSFGLHKNKIFTPL